MVYIRLISYEQTASNAHLYVPCLLHVVQLFKNLLSELINHELSTAPKAFEGHLVKEGRQSPKQEQVLVDDGLNTRPLYLHSNVLTCLPQHSLVHLVQLHRLSMTNCASGDHSQVHCQDQSKQIANQSSSAAGNLQWIQLGRRDPGIQVFNFLHFFYGRHLFV